MKNKFKIGSSKISRSLKSLGSDADKDWHILFFIFILSLVGVCAWGIFDLYSLDREGDRDKVSPAIERAELINKNTLDKVLSDYEKRGEIFEGLKTTKPDIDDPAK